MGKKKASSMGHAYGLLKSFDKFGAPLPSFND